MKLNRVMSSITLVFTLVCMTALSGGQKVTRCLFDEDVHNTVDLQCDDARSILHVYRVIEGRTASSTDTQCIYEEADCVQEAEDLTMQLRLHCDMKHECSQTFSIRPLSRCNAQHRGRNFVSIFYICLTGQSQESVPILSPQEAHMRSVEGIHVYLQTSSYPREWESFSDTLCEIKLAKTTVSVRVDIFDLSYVYNGTEQDVEPYCISTGSSPDTDSTNDCAKNATTFTREIVPSTTGMSYLRLHSQSGSSKDILAKFWIQISAIGANNHWAEDDMSVSCDVVQLTSAPPSQHLTPDQDNPDSTSPTSSPDPSMRHNPLLAFMLGGSIACLVTLVILVVILASVCARRKRRRESQLYSEEMMISVSEMRGGRTCCPCINTTTLNHEVDDIQPYAMGGVDDEKFTATNQYSEIPEHGKRRSQTNGSLKNKRESSTCDSLHRHSYVSIPERIPSYTTNNPLYFDIEEGNEHKSQLDSDSTGAHGNKMAADEVYASPHSDKKNASVLYSKPDKCNTLSLDDELVIVENDLYGS